MRKPCSMQWQMKKEVEARERLVPDFEKTVAYEEKIRQFFQCFPYGKERE